MFDKRIRGGTLDTTRATRSEGLGHAGMLAFRSEGLGHGGWRLSEGSGHGE